MPTAGQTFESAMERTMASGVPVAVARAVSTEAPELLAPSRSVLGFIAVQPTQSNAGSSYVVTTGTHTNEIAIFASDGSWHFTTPYPGYILYDQQTTDFYKFDGSSWGVFSIHIPNIAQGDILYGSAVNTLATLPKNTSATRYLSNTGTNNNPAWAQVNLTNGVTGVLPSPNGGATQILSGGAASTVNYTAQSTDKRATVRFNTQIGGAELTFTVSKALGSVSDIWECDLERDRADTTGNPITVLDTDGNFVGQIENIVNGLGVPSMKIRADGSKVYRVTQG